MPMAERMELEAIVESLGQRAVRDSEAGGGDKGSSSMTPMETGRPAVIPPHRWWAEGEQRGCQMTAVEEPGAGGWVGICEPTGSQGYTQEQKHSLGCTREQKPSLG